jgi:uncharacterized protein
MHLQSARAAEVLVRLKQAFKEPPGPSDRMTLTGADAVAALDSALIEKGVVVSASYLLGTSDISVPDEYRQVREENDWTAAQAALHPGRLVAFCSVNPLKDYAEAEVGRCAATGLRGLKLHFTNSAVDLSDPAHLERLKSVFAAADANGLPILVHMRTRTMAYGATEARAFFDAVLPAAPRVPVVVAHAGGWGGYDRATDSALGAFADACGATPARCGNLWFELSFTALPPSAAAARPRTPLRMLADAQAGFPEAYTRLAARIRSLGPARVLFGSDWPGMTPLETQDALRRVVPLDAGELTAIFGNAAPYLR